MMIGEDKSLDALVVVEAGRPVGLIMSLHLDRVLSREFGVSLYYEKPVTRIMDPEPLMVEAEVQIEVAARQAMGRDSHRIYDHVIVTGQGQPLGIVSVWQILDALAALQQERSSQLKQVNRQLEAEVAERKRAEAALASHAKDLARSNAELEQFAYIASHDLQEPLRAISGFLQLLEQRYRDLVDDKGQDYINRSVAAARRMQTLIRDLLQYSRVGTRGKEFGPVDLAGVLAVSLENLDAAVSESQAVISHDSLPTIQGDDTQLVQLFQNLIGNAIKFRGQDSPRVHVGASLNGDKYVFSVRDNGIGIDPKHADRIFLIFQRLHTRQEYPGTGLGLALCKKIVERHGGRIWVESEPGQGAAFHFTLPHRGAS